MKPTPDQLRDFFKSDIFQADQAPESNYERAIEEFYRRFYDAPAVAAPLPNPRKWQTTYVRKYAIKAFMRTKDGNIHHVIFNQELDKSQITNFDGSPWEGDPNLLDVWQEYYESDNNMAVSGW
ncbi:hypothetical protein [Dyadobacter sp. CY326]|uniref:hypothetical protein n=1 Tax=Dyadobacter sp. CY326 TaxID=2907300 RepID=UPI001F3E554B|nr:hypothetical protein [Dyadobacter sp. CY326]MCE7063793.1 hypothetical protein [Dyadobacter sp. CY326]